MYRTVASLLLVLASSPLAAAEILISKGTTICALDPADLVGRDAAEVRCKGDAYLPPGTVIDRIQNGWAPQTLLLQTRIGVVGRATPRSDFWREQDFNQFKDAKKVAFLTEDAAIRGATTADGKPCKATRREWFRVDDDTQLVFGGDEIPLSLSRRSECQSQSHVGVVTLPRDNVIVVRFEGSSVIQVDNDDNPVRLEPYRPIVLENLFTFPKNCGVEIDSTGKVTGELKFDLGKLLNLVLQGLGPSIAAGFEGNISFKTVSPKERQETSQFFKGAMPIQIGTRKNCKKEGENNYTVPLARWFYVATDRQNGDLVPEWLSERVRIGSDTKTAQISCAKEYFAVARALDQGGFPREAIPFLISRIAEIRSFGADDRCGKDRAP